MEKTDAITTTIRIPGVLVQEILKYQQEQGITTRTSAILELIRKGIESGQKK